MVHKLYILQSLKTQKYYIGHTNNLTRRFKEHNSGQTKSTRYGAPWKIVYTKDFDTKSGAYKMELALKRAKSRKVIENLIHSL